LFACYFQLLLKLKTSLGIDTVVDKTSVVEGFLYSANAYNTTVLHFIGLLQSQAWNDFVQEVKEQITSEDDKYASQILAEPDWNPQEEEEEEEEVRYELEAEEAEVRRRQQPPARQHVRRSAEPAASTYESPVSSKRGPNILKRRTLDRDDGSSGSSSGTHAAAKRRLLETSSQLPASSPVKKNAKFVFATPAAPTTLRLATSAKKGEGGSGGSSSSPRSQEQPRRLVQRGSPKGPSHRSNSYQTEGESSDAYESE
jgi:hypothetical protein